MAAAQEDLVQSLCQGAGQKFHGILCAHYDPAANVCALLRDEPLHAVFEKGRCQPFQRIVQPLVARHLTRYGYQHVCQDFGKSVHALAEGFTEQYLHPQRLHAGYTLYVLWKFINGVLYCKILDYVQEEGILPKMICGECVHLSLTKPHCCERITLSQKKDAALLPNPFYRQKRTPGERACKEGFEPYTSASVKFLNGLEQPPDEEMQQQIVFEHWAFLLSERVEQARTAEERKIWSRQHLVFVRMAQVRGDGLDWSDAMACVAEECGVHPKTIKRDVQQMWQFFHVKCPEWFKTPDLTSEERPTA